MLNNAQLLDIKPKESLKVFLKEYSSIKDFNVDYIESLILKTIRYYDKKDIPKEEVKYILDMVEKWYESLDHGIPDYSIYDDPLYFIDLWVCWHMYSRWYLRSLRHPKSFDGTQSVRDITHPIRGILDMGCGIGYTTASLKQLYPTSSVTGVNLTGTEQYKFCEKMAKKYKFLLIGDHKEVRHEVDLIFASEFFEHIENAIPYTEEVISFHKPKFVITANAFNTYSLGHFKSYIGSEGEPQNQKDMNKLFKKKMVSMGYEKLKTKIWNDRPAVWKLK